MSPAYRAPVVLLLLLAMLASWISPACKFRSGEMTWMEICGDFGVRRIAVPADQNPFAPPPPAEPAHETALADCAFCIAAVQGALAPGSDTIVFRAGFYPVPGLRLTPLERAETRAAQFPRGPPAAHSLTA